ncbi:ATP-binding protein [Fictibacillus sp. Mic-4]|uniref:ATP-binding protein n=1 Tax=Fictibacillus sp. Mic-4 TaxID=3132826 RepID=UPI003CE9C095
MQSVSKVMGNITMAFKVLDTFECECGQVVELIETPILGGPQKGQLMQYKKNCRCEDLKILEKIRQDNREQAKRKVTKIFDLHSLINPKLKEATFGSFRRDLPENTPEQNQSLSAAYFKATEYVKTFKLEEPKNLLFQGTFGNGKSHLAVSIAKAIRDKGYSVIFISTPKLLTKIRSTYNKNSEQTELDVIRHIELADLVVFDDIGAESTNEGWAMQKLFEVFDQRSGKHNVFTTNLSSQEFEAKKDLKRIFSRLMQDTEPVVINAKDYRKRHLKKAVSS